MKTKKINKFVGLLGLIQIFSGQRVYANISGKFKSQNQFQVVAISEKNSKAYLLHSLESFDLDTKDEKVIFEKTDEDWKNAVTQGDKDAVEYLRYIFGEESDIKVVPIEKMVISGQWDVVKGR